MIGKKYVQSEKQTVLLYTIIIIIIIKDTYAPGHI